MAEAEPKTKQAKKVRQLKDTIAAADAKAHACVALEGGESV